MKKVILSKEIKDLGVKESDVQNMMKAVGIDRQEYEPSLSELRKLLTAAYEQEKQRKRVVVLWAQLLHKLV